MMLRLRLTHAALLALTTLSLIACDAEEQGPTTQAGELSAGASADEGGASPEPAGGGGVTGGSGGTGGTGGTGGAEGGGVSEGGAGGEVSACALEGALSQDLLPSLRSTQIHPDAVWDGEAFWVTWTLPNDEGKFEIWAGRFGCDLTPIVEPFPLDQRPGMNDTDSVIAVNGDQVMVAWMRDNSFADGATYNLGTLTQRLSRVTGERVGEVQLVSLSVAGEPKEGNLWMPDLAPSPEGGFVLVASWGNPEVNSFQVVMLPLDDQGVEGDGWLIEEGGRDQTSPTLSQYGSTYDVLWSGKGEGGAEGFWAKTWRLSEGAWVSDELIDLSDRDWVSASVGRGVNQRYREALNPSDDEQSGPPYLIGSKQGGAVELINPSGVRGAAGPDMVTSLGPTFGYGLIASYQRITGTQSKVWWRSVSAEGALQPISYFQQDGPAAPYPLSITPFPGGHLALWAQGNNPEFMLKATLLPTP